MQMVFEPSHMAGSGGSEVNRSVSRATPSGRLSIHSASPSRTSTSSTLPPPTSNQQVGPAFQPERVAGGAENELRLFGARDDFDFEAGLPPDARDEGSRFCASRTALVATAQIQSTRRTLARRAKFLSARTASSIGSRASLPLVNALRPSRTISLTRSMTSKCPSRRPRPQSPCGPNSNRHRSRPDA